MPKQSEKRFAVITLLNNFGEHETYTKKSLELKNIKTQEELNDFADEVAKENWEDDGDVECTVARAVFIPEKDFLVLQKYGI